MLTVTVTVTVSPEPSWVSPNSRMRSGATSRLLVRYSPSSSVNSMTGAPKSPALGAVRPVKRAE